MKKVIAIVGSLITSLCIFIWTQIVTPSIAENFKPLVTKMLKKQLDKIDFLDSDSKKLLVEDLSNQTINKYKEDLSCKQKESLQECQTRILKESGVTKLAEDLNMFNATYKECETDVTQIPNIDLQNDNLIFHLKIRCMIVRNQGQMLDKIAETEPHLVQTIKEVKQNIFPAYK